jgi:hypothetical protein
MSPPDRLLNELKYRVCLPDDRARAVLTESEAARQPTAGTDAPSEIRHLDGREIISAEIVRASMARDRPVSPRPYGMQRSSRPAWLKARWPERWQARSARHQRPRSDDRTPQRLCHTFAGQTPEACSNYLILLVSPAGVEPALPP